jgi:hypothetical protein
MCIFNFIKLSTIVLNLDFITIKWVFFLFIIVEFISSLILTSSSPVQNQLNKIKNRREL